MMARLAIRGAVRLLDANCSQLVSGVPPAYGGQLGACIAVQACKPYTPAQHYSSQHAKVTSDSQENGSTADTPEAKSSQDAKKPEVSEHITMFHRPSQSLLNVSPKGADPQVTFFFRKTDEVMNLTFNDSKATSGDGKEEEAKESELDPSVKSIDELMWKPTQLDIKKLPDYYMKLSKIRLSGLVVLTAMGGYAMAPGVFDPTCFLLTSVGTMLCSAGANATNQFLEVPYDSQMNRTKNRVLVRRHLTPLHAIGFVSVTATMGVSLLTLGVNPLTGALGALNFFLYTSVYTPMKRLSIVNTWIGSVVGAIPPMMGWAACTGTLDAGALLMGAILYAWQFPHFNALSWNLRPDYSRAGYRMMSVTHPALCKRTTFRYCLSMVGLCTLAPLMDVTTWTFAIDSLPLNLYLSWLGWRFYRDGDSKSSRKLFRFSLVHIPALLILMIISKKSYGKKTDTSDGKVFSEKDL